MTKNERPVERLIKLGEKRVCSINVDQLEKLWSVQSVADALSISTELVKLWIQHHGLPATNIRAGLFSGQDCIIRHTDLVEFLIRGELSDLIEIAQRFPLSREDWQNMFTIACLLSASTHVVSDRTLVAASNLCGETIPQGSTYEQFVRILRPWLVAQGHACECVHVSLHWV